MGDTVPYSIDVTDEDSDLDSLVFVVTDGNGTEKHGNSWSLSGDYAQRFDAFLTSGWATGEYDYFASAQDESGLEATASGSFTLEDAPIVAPPPDIPPLPEPTEELITPTTGKVVISSYSGMTLHKNPSIASEVIARLPYNTVLSALATPKPIGNWLYVRTDDGKEGWVYREFLSEGNGIEPPPRGTEKETKVISWAYDTTVDLRITPSNSRNFILWEVKEGTTVQVIETRADYPFTYVMIESAEPLPEEVIVANYSGRYKNFNDLSVLNGLQGGVSGWVHNEFLKDVGVSDTQYSLVDMPFKAESVKDGGVVNQIFFDEMFDTVHYAVDYNLQEGAPVFAVANGAVYDVVTAQAGDPEGLGNVVVTEHLLEGKTYFFVYGHLQSISVSEGDTISPDTQIGTVGGTEAQDKGSKVAHLDFGIRTDGNYQGDWRNWLNPAKYVGEYQKDDAHLCMKKLIVDKGIRDSEEIAQLCPAIGIGGTGEHITRKDFRILLFEETGINIPELDNGDEPISIVAALKVTMNALGFVPTQTQTCFIVENTDEQVRFIPLIFNRWYVPYMYEAIKNYIVIGEELMDTFYFGRVQNPLFVEILGANSISKSYASNLIRKIEKEKNALDFSTYECEYPPRIFSVTSEIGAHIRKKATNVSGINITLEKGQGLYATHSIVGDYFDKDSKSWTNVEWYKVQTPDLNIDGYIISWALEEADSMIVKPIKYEQQIKNYLARNDAMFDMDLMIQLTQHYDTYLSIESQYDVPWEMMSAIHYRENNSSNIPPTGSKVGTVSLDGAWQITQSCPDGMDKMKFEEAAKCAGYLLQSKCTPNYCLVDYSCDPSCKDESCNQCEHIDCICTNKLTKGITDINVIQDAIMGYNTRTYGNGKFEISPYVTNWFNKAGVLDGDNKVIVDGEPQLIISSKRDGIPPRKDGKYGAYRIFLELKKMN